MSSGGAFQQDCGTNADCGNVVAIDKLFYQFPINSSLTATIGSRVGQDNLLAVWPSVYPADTILDVFTYSGAPGAYNKNLGPGAGLWWKNHALSLSANDVAVAGDWAATGAGLLNAFALSGYWQPGKAALMPSLSAGMAFDNLDALIKTTFQF